MKEGMSSTANVKGSEARMNTDGQTQRRLKYCGFGELFRLTLLQSLFCCL